MANVVKFWRVGVSHIRQLAEASADAAIWPGELPKVAIHYSGLPWGTLKARVPNKELLNCHAQALCQASYLYVKFHSRRIASELMRLSLTTWPGIS